MKNNNSVVRLSTALLIVACLTQAVYSQQKRPAPVQYDLNSNPCGPVPLLPNAKLVIKLEKPVVVNEYAPVDPASLNNKKRIANLTYDCNEGFYMEGSPDVACNEEYLMFTAFPRCVPEKSCGPAPEIDGGEAVWQTFTGPSGYGDKVGYECAKAYRMGGGSVITCGLDGYWSTRPYCTTRTFGCNPPPEFDHFIITDKSYTDDTKIINNDQVVYGCDSGYIISNGTATLKCNGTHWVGKVPQCILAPDMGCGPAPWAEHAVVTNKSFVNDSSNRNDYVTFACHPGYETGDDLTVLCLDTGRWTRLPNCDKIKSCDTPPAIAHGRVSEKNYIAYPRPGANVTYICHNNFKLNGSATIRCGEEFKWAAPPKCDELPTYNCTTVPVVQNAVIEEVTNATGVPPKPGDTVSYKCIDNYRMIGPKMVRCLVSLGWSSRPACVPSAGSQRRLDQTTPQPTAVQPLACGQPPLFPNTVAVAKSFGKSAKPGDIVVYACDNGYERASDSSYSVLCAQGRWLGQVRCTQSADSCSPPPSIENAQYVGRSFYGNRGVEANTIAYRCKRGYSPANKRGISSSSSDYKIVTATCTRGQWNNLIVCVQSGVSNRQACTGEPPAVRRARIIGTGYSDDSRLAGDFVMYQCLPNTTLASSAIATDFAITDDDRIPLSVTTVKCLGTGSWSPAPVCTDVDAQATTCGPIPKLEPNVIVIAAEGVVGSPPSRKLYSRINDYLQVDCNPGFELNATADKIVCQSDGTWTRSPGCINITCGPLPPVPNNAVLLSKSFLEMSNVNDFAIFKCRSGYRLANSTGRATCTASGNWSQPYPSCQRLVPLRSSPIPQISCSPSPPLPQDATLTYTSYASSDDPYAVPKVGDFVVYSCPAGSLVMGNTTITCLVGGRWTTPNPCTTYGESGEYRGGRLRGAQCLKSTTDPRHTSCLEDSYDLVTLRPLNSQLILDEHNRYRMNVTPPAKNMKSLSWDDELAVTAERWAAQCTTSNDEGRYRAILQKGWRWIGQNIYASATEFTPLQAINSWADERKYWAYGLGSTNAGQVVGHYTQMIWAQTLYIGCGMARCDPVKNPLSNIIVCNYAPGGNTAYVGQNPYAQPYEAAGPAGTMRTPTTG